MAIWDSIFFRRKRERGEFPDVFQTTRIPDEGLRVQVFLVLRDFIGSDVFVRMHEQTLKDYGVRTLVEMCPKGTKLPGSVTREKDFELFLENCDCSVRFVDIIQRVFVSLGVHFRATRGYGYRNPMGSRTPWEMQEELNEYFRRAGFGFEFDGEDVRQVENTFTHQEVVRPSLECLRAAELSEAESYFNLAFEHYKQSNFGDSAINAGLAFEATMKGIAQGMSYTVHVRNGSKPSASDYIKCLKDEEFIPKYLWDSFGQIDKMLQAASTVRNQAGHPTDVEKTKEFAMYGIHLSASNIVFLVEIYKAKKGV